MSPTLPEVPVVTEGTLERHDAARRRLRGRLDDTDPLATAVCTHLQRRVLLESLATVWPIRPLQRETLPLLPPRRRFLTPEFTARLEGARRALDYVDARVRLVEAGHLDRLVEVETPHVLNALAERTPGVGAHGGTPGLTRATESGFDATETDFRPPPPEHVDRLVRDAIAVASAADAPAVVRAAWLAFVVFAVHPFTDGNGRTARLLYQLLAGASPELGPEPGAIELWAAHRRDHIAAIRRGTDPSLPDYDGRRLRALPFVEYAVERATAAAELAVERLDVVARDVATNRRDGWSDVHELVERVVTIDRNVTLAELDDGVVGDGAALGVVTDLVADGALTVDAAGRIQATRRLV